MSGEALERKKGLDHEWGERGVERRPLTAEGINTELPLPCWGFVTWCKGGEWRNTRERELPLFLNPWLRPRSWLSLMKTSKTLADSHTHTHTHLQKEFSRTERGHDRGGWRRQKFDSCDPSGRIGNEGGETTERMWNVNGWRGGMKAEPPGFLSLCWPPFSLSSESPQFCSVPGRVGMFLCASVFACVFPPSREISWLCFFPTHLQCLVNSRKQLDRKRERRQHWKRDDRKSKRMIEWVRNRCIQSL